MGRIIFLPSSSFLLPHSSFPQNPSVTSRTLLVAEHSSVKSRTLLVTELPSLQIEVIHASS